MTKMLIRKISKPNFKTPVYDTTRAFSKIHEANNGQTNRLTCITPWLQHMKQKYIQTLLFAQFDDSRLFS